MRNMLALSIATLATLGTLTASPAQADQIEPADRVVKTQRVVYAEQQGRRLYVELNNGATYSMRPCRYEDSRNCFWSAGQRGNGVGTSFVDVKGDLIRIPARVMSASR